MYLFRMGRVSDGAPIPIGQEEINLCLEHRKARTNASWSDVFAPNKKESWMTVYEGGNVISVISHKPRRIQRLSMLMKKDAADDDKATTYTMEQ